MKLLVILGHPRNPSFCAALAQAYADGARAAGMTVRTLDLGALRFDPDVHPLSPADQPLEPDLAHALELIVWAEHIVFVYPAWWGVGPARLRGFLDRVLLPGVAFREQGHGHYTGLLQGRTAHLLITLDMPPAIYRFVYRAPGIHAMKRSVLGFCGIETTKVLALGPLTGSSAARRAAWIERARALGFSLQDGARPPAERIAARLLAWLKALRLQFHPFTWIAYSMGALGAAHGANGLDRAAYGWGYLCVFCIELLTVFINESFDFESDRNNRNGGLFNGGSRVLVDSLLSRRQLAIAGGVVLLIAAASGGWLLEREGVEAGALATVLALSLLLGPGYTAPPLKLGWRGLGELDVALTHSFAVVLFGHLAQGGAWSDPFPWLISIPVFLAVLPSIILAGIPDADADRQAGKRTLAVRFGHRAAIVLAGGAALAAAFAAVLVLKLEAMKPALLGLPVFVLPHAFLLLMLLHRQWREPAAPARIDLLMALALGYLLWFVVVPLFNLY